MWDLKYLCRRTNNIFDYEKDLYRKWNEMCTLQNQC